MILFYDSVRVYNCTNANDIIVFIVNYLCNLIPNQERVLV